MKKWITIILVLFVFNAFSQVETYLKALKEQGQTPIAFVSDKLKTHDLIVFDDGLHNALEPFEFYNELLSADSTIDYVFVEIFGINAQPHIDAFLESDSKDLSLLYPVFQDDFSGLGWVYKTSLDLLTHVWDLNHSGASNVKVIGVDQPIYWEGIHTREQYDIFRQSVIGRDYFMYRIITSKMKDFKEGLKGIFLTNTRHAYKNIENSMGTPYWNAGTFFYNWHPEKTYTVRFHNVILNITAKKENVKNQSMAGMDRITYNWARMEGGLWDKAFAENKNQPIAIPLKNTPFGNATYVGNHMLDVREGQTMLNAYDAIIFLKPLEELHFSAKTDFFYTPEFKKELDRRIRILQEGTLEKYLERNEASNVQEFIEELAQAAPATSNTLIPE
ncbi:MAG: hypothetical protein Tsb0034_19530 [Ekhidna sp.]